MTGTGDMKIITELDPQFAEHQKWFEEAGKIAQQSTCQRAQCGTILVANNQIIGSGFNSPAGNEPSRCLQEYTLPENNKYDVTCCVHAEVRAIHNALHNNSDAMQNSTLYFMRLKHNQITKAGVPYCTLCSKEALDSGVQLFALWHEQGITLYTTQEYNDISYNYFKDPNLWQLK